MSNNSKKAPSPRILIVEDDLDINMMLADMLKAEGYHVDAVRSGIQTLLQVPQKTYDAVILDMGMPDLSGRAVQHAFSAFHPSLPIIVHTGEISLELKQLCFYNGAFAYFTKPCNLDELKRMVRAAVALGRGNQG